MTPEPERSPKGGRPPSEFILALFLLPSISWFVFLGYREFVHSEAGFADSIIAVVDGMESAVVFFGAVTYAAVEVNDMLAERYKKWREEVGRQEGEAAALSAVEEAAKNNGMAEEAIHAMINRAREIVRRERAK